MPIVKPGSDWDTHGCINSAGYIWCEILNECIRTWITACFTRNNPSCQVYEPEVSIEPWLVGDGH